jgi:hypothetical protein
MHYRIKLFPRYKAYIRRDADVFHVGSATQNANPVIPNCPSWQFEGIRAYYIRKWGGGPGEETFTNPWNNPEYATSAWHGLDAVEPEFF